MKNNKQVVYKITTIAALAVALATTGILSSSQAEASSLANSLVPKPCLTAPGQSQGGSTYYATIVSAEPEHPSPSLSGALVHENSPEKVKIIGQASGPCKISSMKFTWYLNGQSFGSATYTGSAAKSSFTLLPNHVTQYIQFPDLPCKTIGNDVKLEVDFSDGTDRSAWTKIWAASYCPG